MKTEEAFDKLVRSLRGEPLAVASLIKDLIDARIAEAIRWVVTVPDPADAMRAKEPEPPGYCGARDALEDMASMLDANGVHVGSCVEFGARLRKHLESMTPPAPAPCSECGLDGAHKLQCSRGPAPSKCAMCGGSGRVGTIGLERQEPGGPSTAPDAPCPKCSPPAPAKVCPACDAKAMGIPYPFACTCPAPAKVCGRCGGRGEVPARLHGLTDRCPDCSAPAKAEQEAWVKDAEAHLKSYGFDAPAKAEGEEWVAKARAFMAGLRVLEITAPLAAEFKRIHDSAFRAGRVDAYRETADALARIVAAMHARIKKGGE